MKLLVLTAFVLAVAGAAAGCHFDAQDACNHCPWDNNWIQFVADGCNCSVFYLCEKRNGVIVPHAQSCNPCFCFSNEKWTCVQFRNDSSCPTAPPPGTDPAVTGPSRRNFFCVDFDLDYRDQREYYDVDPLCRIVSVSEQYSPGDLYHTGLKTSGMALLSDGSPCHVEIPFFQNNQFTQFTLCVFFNYFAPPNTAMGLVVNGCPDDVNPGSIQILLTAQHQVRAEVKTAGSNYVITNSLAVSPFTPHEVCFIYDGSQGTKLLELVVDDYVEKQFFADGLDGMTVAEKCNLRLGEVLDQQQTSNPLIGFVGLLDTFCFSPNIVSESYFLAP